MNLSSEEAVKATPVELILYYEVVSGKREVGKRVGFALAVFFMVLV